MPDETQTGTQAAAGAQPQAGNAADQTTQQTQTSGTSQADAQQTQGQQQTQQATTDQPKPTLEEVLAKLERAEKDLGETRKEAAAHRVKAKELDKLREEAETAKLDEAGKAAKRAEKAEQALTASRQRIGRAELKVAAQAAGIIDPDDAVAHLAGRIEFDDDGEPKDVAALVTALKTAKPHLFGAGKDAAAAQAAAQTAAKQAQAQAAGQAMGATNAARQSGALTVTANQYMDPKFSAEFKATYGMDVLSAVRTGKAHLI